ncbi:MAG: hypothetical protein COA33_014865 [Fluviicola sp.]|nr:hypothetical protein [Fluviicola sp.]
MKAILFASLFLLVNVSFSQTESNINYSLTIEKYHALYILDSAYYPREKIPWITSKRRHIQFLNIDKEDVLLLASFSRSHSHYGEMGGLKVYQNESGKKVISFFTRGKGYNIGQVMSFDVEQLSGTNYIIKYYNKFGNVNDVFFYAHKATEAEISEVLTQVTKKDDTKDEPVK